MTRIRALFSLIQYIPVGGRAEAANVGVALFVPSLARVFVRTSPTLDRVKRFFKPDKKQMRRVELAVEALKYRLEHADGEFTTEEQFAHFVAARADAVRLTEPLVAATDNPAAKLDALYAELVGEGEAVRVAPLPPLTFPPRAAELFGRLRAEGRVWTPGKVQVPEAGDELEIPLAYKNGVVNLVLPRSLAAADRPKSKLPKLGYHGLLIDRHEVQGEKSKLVVMSTNPTADEDAEKQYAEVLADFQVRFVPYAKSDAFAAEVEREAHV